MDLMVNNIYFSFKNDGKKWKLCVITTKISYYIHIATPADLEFGQGRETRILKPRSSQRRK